MSILHYIRQKQMDKQRFIGNIKTIYGFMFPVDTHRSDLDEVLYKHRVHEKTLCDFMVKELKEGDIFVDVGANQGYHTILGAIQVGKTGKVYAFEPNKEAYAILKENTKNYPQVKLFNIGLGSEKTTVNFFEDKDNMGTSKVVKKGNTQINIIRGDTVITHAKIIKIDVEGYEPEVLAGFTRTKAEFILIDGWCRE